MRFHYIAFQNDGKTTEGETEAKDPADVLVFLARRSLRPISVKPVELKLPQKGKIFFGQAITVADKVFLTKYLALMLRVGTDLFKAIDILIADFDKPIVKALLGEIRSALERGEPFHATFARYPKYFSEIFVNLIKAGESSGNLDQIFSDLSAALERENELRGRIRAALTYPVILVGMATMILVFLVTFALPKIADVFLSSGIEPPIFSKIVFGVGLFLGKYIWIMLPIVIGAIVGLYLFMSKTQSGRRALGRLSYSLPLVRTIMKQSSLQRFAGTLSSLLRAGLPILDSIEITANAVGNIGMKESLQRIAREGISKGLTVGDAFKKEPVFPKVVVNLVAISEKAGHLDEILKTLADFYELEIDKALKTLVSFLEPALLTVLGLVVAVIALSIILPIYQLVGQF